MKRGKSTRILLCFALALLAASLLVGCGSTPEPAPKKSAQVFEDFPAVELDGEVVKSAPFTEVNETTLRCEGYLTPTTNTVKLNGRSYVWVQVAVPQQLKGAPYYVGLGFALNGKFFDETSTPSKRNQQYVQDKVVGFAYKSTPEEANPRVQVDFQVVPGVGLVARKVERLETFTAKTPESSMLEQNPPDPFLQFSSTQMKSVSSSSIWLSLSKENAVFQGEVEGRTGLMMSDSGDGVNASTLVFVEHLHLYVGTPISFIIPAQTSNLKDIVEINKLMDSPEISPISATFSIELKENGFHLRSLSPK